MKRALSLLGTVACLAAPAVAQAQASEAEMKAFPMPPPTGYHAQKAFAYVGDYGYYTAPAVASYSLSANKAQDYKYVRYTGVGGKRVFVYGAWGPSVPPDPPGEADACGHSHSSWGVWGRWQIQIAGFNWNGWTMMGGGGMSGERNAQGKCVQKTSTSLASIDSRFGWGTTFKEIDLRSNPWVKELVVGALSNTHGWGTCAVPAGQFPACREPSYVIGYTLP